MRLPLSATRVFSLAAILLIAAAVPARADSARRRAVGRAEWRREALQTMRVAAAGQLISERQQLAAYVGAGFNTLCVFDVNGYTQFSAGWDFKTAEQVRFETSFAREKGMPLILGLAVEPHDTSSGRIAEATDAEIRARLQLWKTYGDDVVIGVFPWYDDVFWQTVDVGRQLHIYRLIKEVVPDWYVFGMIGEFGFKATEDEVRRHYEPAAFDHLIALMYPYDLCGVVGASLDHKASADPDGDLTRYVDRYIAGMELKFFRYLQPGQLIVLVGQAFYYPGQAEGRTPRGQDIAIMMGRGMERVRELAGQERNYSAAYYHWGAEGGSIVGLWQRPDWLEAAREVHARMRAETVAP